MQKKFCKRTDPPSKTATYRYCICGSRDGGCTLIDRYKCSLVDNWTDENGCPIKKWHCRYYKNVRECGTYCSNSVKACICPSRYGYIYTSNCNELRGYDAQEDFIIGGLEIFNCHNGDDDILRGGSYSIDIYKDGNFFQRIGEVAPTGCGSLLTSSKSVSLQDVDATFKVSDLYEDYEFKWMKNIYNLNKRISFPYNISIDHIEEDNKSYMIINLSIRNINNISFYGDIGLKLCEEIFTGETVCKNYKKKTEIKPFKIYNYTWSFPIKKYDEIEIVPIIIGLIDINNIHVKNLNVRSRVIKSKDGRYCYYSQYMPRCYYTQNGKVCYYSKKSVEELPFDYCISRGYSWIDFSAEGLKNKVIISNRSLVTKNIELGNNDFTITKQKYKIKINANLVSSFGEKIRNSNIIIYICPAEFEYCDEGSAWIYKTTNKTDDKGNINTEIETLLPTYKKYKISIVTSQGYAEALINT